MKKLGILGGMGPAATADFLRLLAILNTHAQKDQDHPIIYLLSDPTTPDRSSAICDSAANNPASIIENNLNTLAEWGADVLAVPCNTAHYFIDRFTRPLPRPLIHIIKETVEAAREIAPKAWIIATIGTMRSGIYQDYAKRTDYELIIPNDDIKIKVQNTVEMVKAGEIAKSGTMMRIIAETLWELEDIPIILACTELPLAYDASELPQEKCVSSLVALAKACNKYIYQ